MSLESAKKYGLIASLINILLPIVSLVLVGVVLFQFISQILNNIANIDAAEISMLGSGVVAGVGVFVGVIGIVGLSMFLLSMYKLSKYYKEPQIFRYIIYALIIQIIAASVIVVFTLTLTVNNPDLNNVQDIIARVMSMLVVAIAVSIIVSIINGVFYWQAFTKLGEKSGVQTFKTAGLLYFIGSITTVMGGVGAIIIWISWIFVTLSYRQLKPQQLITTCTTQTTNHNNNLNNSDIIYCSQCGIDNNTDNIYCIHCGATLQTT